MALTSIRALDTDSYDKVLQVLGCKWGPSIMELLERGIHRPGRIEREIPGLTQRVLHRCMDRLQEFGLVERTLFPEVPPRVEYTLTERGADFMRLLGEVRAHAQSWQQAG